MKILNETILPLKEAYVKSLGIQGLDFSKETYSFDDDTFDSGEEYQEAIKFVKANYNVFEDLPFVRFQVKG
jgi:hypothetical protein